MGGDGLEPGIQVCLYFGCRNQMALSKGLTEERLLKDYLQGVDRVKDGKAPREPQEQEAVTALCLLPENESNGKPESRKARSCINYRLISRDREG